jgi:hypothetical protein
MYKILVDNKWLAGELFAKLDSNFLAIINAMLKMANPDYTLKGYADTGTIEPTTPTTNDCYLVTEAGTIWSLEVVVNNFIIYDGSDWTIATFTLNELNTVLQSVIGGGTEFVEHIPSGTDGTFSGGERTGSATVFTLPDEADITKSWLVFDAGQPLKNTVGYSKSTVDGHPTITFTLAPFTDECIIFYQK